VSGRKIKRRENGLPNAKTGPRPKNRMQVAGMVGQTEYVNLKMLVLARPSGGEGVWLTEGKFRLLRSGRCEKCGERLACDAHHRVLTAQGGPDVASNLAALCRQCHDWCHLHPDEARLGGWILRSGDDFRARAILVWDGSIVLLDDEAGYSFQKWPTK
jgi:hypothetical protein